MWSFSSKTLKDRYSKLVKLIMSIDSHFQITEDKEDSLRLHLPNYKGNQTMDFHIYLMEPQLHISFVTEIEGEKISVLSYFDQYADQQDMFNAAMARNLDRVRQVLNEKNNDGEKQDYSDGNYDESSEDKDSEDNSWGLRDYYDAEESFKKHALTIMILHRGFEFRYFASERDSVPIWKCVIGDYDCPYGAEPFAWIMSHYENRNDFCWLLDLLDEDIAHLWSETMKEPEELIREIQRYVPRFKLGNDPHSVRNSLEWSWIDIHAIHHFIDYCSKPIGKETASPIAMKELQDCTSIDDLAHLFYIEGKGKADSEVDHKEEKQPHSFFGLPIIVESWSLLDFAKANGQMKVIPPQYDPLTGEMTKDSFCAFVHKTKKDDQGRPLVIFVEFDQNLGILTPQEIAAQKDELYVVKYDSNKYSLKRKEIEEKENHSTEVTEKVSKMGNIANNNIEMIFCKYCGKRIEANSKFCVYCGKQLNQEVFVLKDFPNNIISALPVNSQEDLDEIICIGNESLVSGDYKKAYFYLREAARFGDAQSAFNTGLLLFYGNGVEKNEERAITFFMQAAEDEFVPAYNSIGVCFALGKGVPKDMTIAVSWYQKGADKGDKLAQNSLGRCYLIGDGVEKNLELGFYWTKKSAEQGYNGSLFNMGYCYETGLGVPKDLPKAIHYYKKALEKGYHQAEQRLEKLQCLADDE